MSITYRTERHIAASAEDVYDRLVDLEGYAHWNTWLIRASGVPSPGAVVEVWPVLKGRPQHYRHLILETSRPSRFAWRDMGWFTLFACGERHRQLHPTPEGHCHYQVELRLNGPFAWLAARAFGRDLEKGLNDEADALCASFAPVDG